MLPELSTEKLFDSNYQNKLLILAEGFEARSLTWIRHRDNELDFMDALICKYNPRTGENRCEELSNAVRSRCSGDVIELDYNRFEPALFEQNFYEISIGCSKYDEIFIDITVMSKLLIMIIMNTLKNFHGDVRIIYTEPNAWGPSEEEYRTEMLKDSAELNNHWLGLSSFGLDSIVKTPRLSSVIMQGSPIFLISFLSFNTSLTWVLLDEISPPKIQFFGHSCERHKWRANAMHEINNKLIKDYSAHGIDFEDNVTADKLNYIAVFEELARIYRERCYRFRIVIAPTGSKLHAVASSLLKICCPDVHVEYPTPKGYCSESYTSDEIYATYQIEFKNFSNFAINLANRYELNG